jgi:hypothetical protein
MENQIKDALINLLEGITLSDTQRTMSGMEAVETLLADSRAGLHPQLVHFLERRSYAKALEFLGGEGAVPRGSCGRR